VRDLLIDCVGVDENLSECFEIHAVAPFSIDVEKTPAHANARTHAQTKIHSYRCCVTGAVKHPTERCNFIPLPY
jgi:hypothetical protein